MKDCGMGCGEEKRAELMEVRRRAARTLLPLGGRDGDNHETLPHTSRVVANAIFSLMPSLVCKTCSLSPHTSRVVANAIFSLMPCLACKTCSLFSCPPPPPPRPSDQATEALVAVEEGNLVLAEDLGSDLIVPALVGEWRLLYTSSNAMEYNQVQSGLNGSFFFHFYDGRLF